MKQREKAKINEINRAIGLFITDKIFSNYEKIENSEKIKRLFDELEWTILHIKKRYIDLMIERNLIKQKTLTNSQKEK